MTNLWIAIPDSCLIDSQSILDKSFKISQISRACSIFCVKKIIVYHDRSVKTEKMDKKILKTILEYLDTPPYLRKKIYPKMWILKHAGILPPIKSPHHLTLIDINKVKDGDVRFGFVIKQNDALYVDVGLEKMITYKGSQLGKKVLVKISKNPELMAEDISKDSIEGYWGYDVQFADSLSTILGDSKNEVLMTSVQGAAFTEHVDDLMNKVKRSKNLVVIFGSPKLGLRKIMESENKQISSTDNFLNMFPRQGTQTVRLEEAILGTLSIINNYLNA
ncbi:MAG TPA: RNA methyltransferase [Nitrososphaeraceae archaeon]|nr:RNA methyltransferase [Nitrososphaeraceae archaeon]